ncbi:unnamed protein product [Orchesella dallaii]|uniref:Uncharacterized protein n=1 Tax=Orchesella dallaii TaxID=48710 RepID=A0ABP1R1G3_9HEXA
MHNGVIRERGGKRARRAGEHVLWQRLTHYVKTHGGRYSREQSLCESCTSKIRTFCSQTGFIHAKKDDTDKRGKDACIENIGFADSGISSSCGSEETVFEDEDLPLTPSEYMNSVYLIPRRKIKPTNQYCRYNALEKIELNFYAKHINKCNVENREKRMKIREEQYMKRPVVSFTSKSGEKLRIRV